MAELKVFSAISAIFALMDSSKRVPLSNLIMVDKQKLEDLLNELQDAYEPELEKAEKLLENERSMLEELDRRVRAAEEKSARESKETIDNANRTAKATLEKATAEANDMMQKAADQANQTVALAQADANRRIAAAQADADNRVAQHTITQRAQAKAAEIEENARQECGRMHQDTVANLTQMLEHADLSLSSQLDALRTLRQQLGVAAYEEPAQENYDASPYPDDGYDG